MNPVKTLLFSIIILCSMITLFATTVTIGHGTSTQRQPITSFFGYERSADIYLASEVGMHGTITDIAWFSTITQNLSLPVKIYMKTTTATYFTSETWSALTTSAILVYDGTITGADANSWKVINTIDFAYNTDNLLVLIECNYGSDGAGSSEGTQWTYTNLNTTMAYRLYADDLPPTEAGIGYSYRSNIQLNINPFQGPGVFVMNHSALDFGSFILNTTSDEQTVNVSNIGGTSMHINSSALGGENPSGFIVTDTNSYPVNLVAGASINFTVKFRPTVGQTYHATLTLTDDLTRTSHVLTLTGFGLNTAVSTFPHSESFDDMAFPPFGWVTYSITNNGYGLWDRDDYGLYPDCPPHSGAALASYQSWIFPFGTQGALVSPPVVLPGNNYRVRFWMNRSNLHAEQQYHNEMISVWLSSTSSLNGADSLGVIHRIPGLLPVEAEEGWHEYYFNFPSTATGVKYIIFKGTACYGQNMYIDDVVFEQQPVGIPLPLIRISPANNAVDQFVTTALSWFPDIESPSPTGYRLSLGTNNPPTNVLNNVDLGLVNSYLPILNGSTTYFWKVVPYNANGNATGCPIWSFTTSQPNTVQIGTNTSVIVSLPLEPESLHSFSQTIYLQPELNQPSSLIRSLYYQYNGGGAWSDSIRVYMGHTNHNVFTLSTDWVPASALTLVYTGLLNVTPELGWVEIPLQEPFIYDNINNLVVCIDKDMSVSHAYTDDFYCTFLGPTRAIQHYSDVENIDIAHLLPGQREYYIPNTRLQFQPMSEEGQFYSYPSNVSFGQLNVFDTSVPINIRIRNIGLQALTITQPITMTGADAEQFNLVDTNSYPNTLAVGQSISVSVVFHPTSEGIKNAILNVTDNMNNRLQHVIPISGFSDNSILPLPSNLNAVVDSCNVHLTWQAPSQSVNYTVTGYNLFRNGNNISTIANPLATSYIDESVPYGLYQYELSAIYGTAESDHSNTFTVDVTCGYPNLVFSDSFENYPDFSLIFSPWSNLDLDQYSTLYFNGVDYLNKTIPKSFMVFNPKATTPQMLSLSSHSGNKILACFDNADHPNNDWLITPQIHLGTNSSFNFWAKSYSSIYGLERYNLLISTTNMEPGSFSSIINGNTVIVPDDQWTSYNYDISAYNNQTVYLAIQCVSNNSVALLVDDVKIVSTGGVGIDDPIVALNQSLLLGNYPNPFNPNTSIRFHLKEKGKVSIDVFNTRGQKVITLLDEVRNAGSQSILWNGKDENGNSIASGVYFYQMKAGNYLQTRKMVLLK